MGWLEYAVGVFSSKVLAQVCWMLTVFHRFTPRSPGLLGAPSRFDHDTNYQCLLTGRVESGRNCRPSKQTHDDKPGSHGRQAGRQAARPGSPIPLTFSSPPSPLFSSSSSFLFFKKRVRLNADFATVLLLIRHHSS